MKNSKKITIGIISSIVATFIFIYFLDPIIRNLGVFIASIYRKFSVSLLNLSYVEIGSRSLNFSYRAYVNSSLLLLLNETSELPSSLILYPSSEQYLISFKVIFLMPFIDKLLISGILPYARPDNIIVL